MNFTIQREKLLKPIQLIIGAVERRQTMPILSNFLLRNVDGRLVITATDLELEVSASIDITPDGDAVTVPGRKLLDICKSLPDNSEISFALSGEKVEIKSGRSRFSLATLAAAEFPLVDSIEVQDTVSVDRDQLHFLIENTYFAMAQQDVRYYLNGLMLEIQQGKFRAVATDGHRLALADIKLEETVAAQQVIVPRKAVHEFMRILSTTDGNVELALSANHLQARMGEIRFVTKLIDGKFPDYQRVIPEGHEHMASIDRELVRAGLMRASILSNEKYRGIRLGLNNERLKIQAHNPEQEEAEEELEVAYQGPELEVGFNVSYLLDVLNTIQSEQVQFYFQDSNSSLLIQSPDNKDCKYVVMPMRL